MDCPICFEVINLELNCLKTECGHQFHTSCMLQNVSHNGFGCPLCRNELVQKNDAEEADDETEWTQTDSDFDDEDDEYEDDEYALRGLRMFMNRTEGNEQDPDDEIDEASEFEDMPPADFIADQLMLDGTSINDLVISLLALNNEYCSSENVTEEYSDVLNETAAKMRKAIGVYKTQRELMRGILVDRNI